MEQRTTVFNKALLTASDLAEYLNVSRCVAYKLMKNEPGFPIVKINSRKYVNKELLDKWLIEQTATAKDGGKKRPRAAKENHNDV